MLVNYEILTMYNIVNSEDSPNYVKYLNYTLYGKAL